MIARAPSAEGAQKRMDVAAMAGALDEGFLETDDPALLAEIEALRAELLSFALVRRKHPEQKMDIPNNVQSRLRALFERLERAADRNAREKQLLSAGLRKHAASENSDTPPEELEYLQSAAADARERSRGLFRDLMDVERRQQQADENTARVTEDAAKIAELRRNLQ